MLQIYERGKRNAWGERGISGVSACDSVLQNFHVVNVHVLPRGLDDADGLAHAPVAASVLADTKQKKWIHLPRALVRSAEEELERGGVLAVKVEHRRLVRVVGVAVVLDREVPRVVRRPSHVEDDRVDLKSVSNKRLQKNPKTHRRSHQTDQRGRDHLVDLALPHASEEVGIQLQKHGALLEEVEGQDVGDARVEEQLAAVDACLHKT